MAYLKTCPRCGKLIPYGWSYCPDCKPQAEEEYQARKDYCDGKRRQALNRKYNQRRKADDPKYRKFRNSKAWRQTSKAKLTECGWRCEARVSPHCTGLACEVHHVIPIKTDEGWERRLDYSNLMCVCVACHNILDH